jgi:hypothetical protein
MKGWATTWLANRACFVLINIRTSMYESFNSKEESMNQKIVKIIALGAFALVIVFGEYWQAQAQDPKAPYASMAPLDQYLMADRNAEIALARSAAPEAISRDADVLVLGRHGYESAVKGKNGFVCAVERGWMGPFNGEDAANFWNPKIRVRSASIRRLPAPSCR